MSVQPADDNWLYDLAIEEVMDAIGDLLAQRDNHKLALPPEIPLKSKDLVELMAQSFLRGQTWARERCNCQHCKEATWPTNDGS